MAKQKSIKNNDELPAFVGKVAVYGGDRLHIEVPKQKRDEFESGDSVTVKKIFPLK